jgi:hypothetical protein
MLEVTESDGGSNCNPCNNQLKTWEKQIIETQKANDQIKSNRKMFEKRLTEVIEANERRERRGREN